MDEVAELANRIERDPADVARQARELAREFRSAGDLPNLSRVLAVLGRSRRMLGDVELAEGALTEALEVASGLGDDELTADAHLALAGVLSLSAGVGDALRHLDAVDQLGSARLREHGSLQRAVLFLRSGRATEALDLFDRAVPRLRSERATRDLARVLANRGGIRFRRGDVHAAITDFEEAESLFDELEQRFAALQVHHNLACAVAGRGDLPTALQMFDETSDGFGELGHDDSLPVLSRAEALLANGISSEALEFAREAVRRLDAEGNHSAAAEALIAVAEAARQEADHAAALDAATRAAAWFESARSDGWFRAANMLVARIRLDSGCVDRSVVDDVAALAVSSRQAGDLRSEITARTTAVVAACSIGDVEIAKANMAAATRAARRSKLLQTRLAVLHARSTLGLVLGDRIGARRSLRQALELVRSTAVPGVGVAGGDAGVNARDVAQLAFDIAVSERTPLRALEWMEHARGAVPAPRPALPPDSDELAELFASLRVASADLRRAEVENAPTAELLQRQSELERVVRMRSLRHTGAVWSERHDMGGFGGVRDEVTDLRDLTGAVGDRELVSIAVSGERLVAVVVDRRIPRIVELGSTRAVSAYATRARAALDGLARSDLSAEVADTCLTVARSAIVGLDAELVAPLHLEADDVVLVVPPLLHSIPWAALPDLRRRAFRLAPSVSWWMAMAQTPQPPPDRVLVVAGPRLPEADAEATEVAGSHRDAVVLRGQEATVERTRECLTRTDLAHVVAHGRFRHDNPLWSTIELSDGTMSVYELERLDSVPATMVLATCDSGRGDTRRSHTFGASVHGLGATLISMGARTVVAAVGALPDSPETRRVMVGVHRRLASGVGAAEAFAEQRRCETEELSDRAGVVAAGLVTLGVG